MPLLKHAAIILAVVLWAAFGQPSSALPSEPIKIGAVYATTGNAARDNVHTIAGVKRAVAEINAAGGVRGQPLQLILFDNNSTPIGSKVAADRAVAQGVVAVVGPDWSSHALAAARVLQAAGIPMITTAATHPDVTRVGNFIFRTCFTDLFQGRVMARFARDQIKAATAVLVVDVTSEYSQGLADEFGRNFNQLGGVIAGRRTYKSKQVEFRPLIRQLTQLEPDVFFIPGHNESGFIAKEVRQHVPSAVPLGGDGWDTDEFLRLGGRELDRGYYCTHWTPESETLISKAFVDEYGATDAANTFTALGRDAVFILAGAITEAHSTEPDKIREALSRTRDFRGVTGSITFDQHGDPIKSAVIIEIRNGTPRYLETVEPE